MENKKTEPFLVKFQNDIYDIGRFVHKHPGGVNTLNGLNDMDMTRKFMAAPPHSDAAMYLMKEYRVNDMRQERRWENNNNNSVMMASETMIQATMTSRLKNDYNFDDNNNNNNNDDDNVDNNVTSTAANGHKAINGILSTKNVNRFDNITLETDDSMEYLVDWSKPMIAQIPSIGHKYTEWVNKPVDRSLRLFEPTWLENLTKTPWWLVPIFWIPNISLILLYGIKDAFHKQYSENYIGLCILLGFIIWTILEYSLHRWIFHLDTTNAGPILCTVHFSLHGLHHKVPFDPYRLVFPPVPAMVLAFLLYQPAPYLFNCPMLILAGTLTGYFLYDMIHYYIHYGNPRIKYFYNLKRYHYQHHFVHHDKGFGISSTIWDIVFGTKILLRKLKYLLKW